MRNFIRPSIQYRETTFADPARNVTINLDHIATIDKEDVPGATPVEDQYRILFNLADRSDNSDPTDDVIVWAFASGTVRDEVLENIEKYYSEILSTSPTIPGYKG